jgi:hypothetical protein
MEDRWVAFYAETTNPLRDKPGAGFSMTKFIAAYFAYLVGHAIGAQGGAVSVNTVALAFLAGSMAFGKSVMNHLINKYSFTAVSTATDARTFEQKDKHIVNETITHLIEERRDSTGGIEATP